MKRTIKAPSDFFRIRKSSSADRVRAMRTRRWRAGLCVTCALAPREPGKGDCAGCAKEARDRYHERKGQTA